MLPTSGVCWVSLTCRADSSPGTNPAASSLKQLPPKADTKALESKSLRARGGGVHFGGGSGSDDEEEGREEEQEDEDGPPLKAKSTKARLHKCLAACVHSAEPMLSLRSCSQALHSHAHAALLGEDQRGVLLLRLRLLHCC